jgi:hypothetical protein
LKGERPHSGLMCFPLLALLLVRDLCPAGMSDRFGGPLHARLSQELGTLETPVHPGFLPAAFSHWRDAGLFLQCSGGRIPFAWLPEGDQEAGRKDGSRAGQGLKQGEIGMTLGVLCNGLIKSLDRVQGHAPLTDEGLDEQGIGGDDALVSGPGRRGFHGVHALGEHLSHPHMVVVKEGLQGGPEYRKIKRPFPPTTAPTPCWGRPAHPAPHALAVAGRPPVRAAGHRQDGWLGTGCRHGWSCSGGGCRGWWRGQIANARAALAL